MKKLILFGDSLFGRCRKGEQLELEAALNNEYDVYNCATGGWDSEDLVRKTPYISGLKPDVVIISIGTNDASPWKLVEIEKFKQNLPDVIDSFVGSRVIMFPPPPISENLRPEDKLMPNTLMKTYYDAVVEICEAKNVEYLRSWDIFNDLQAGGKVYHVEDGVHFNDLGYSVLFDAIAEVLK